MDNSQIGNMPGKWSGTSRLYFGEEVFDSDSTADIQYISQGQFISFSYTWQYQGELQDGQIVFRSSLGEEPSKAAWLDSWHMKNDIMICEGTIDRAGFASLLGSYSYPPGPDWGWRIEIGLDREGSLIMRMFNITPEGQEVLGVHAQFERVINNT